MDNTALSKGEPSFGEIAATFDGIVETPDRYLYLDTHGEGGMGRVLLMHDQILDREVAFKELKSEKRERVDAGYPVFDEEMVARFLREAKITGQLEHPSIAPVHELGRRADGTLYYTMKSVRGKTFEAVISESKILEARIKLLPHFVDLCHGIAYAHSRGVIHRDVKPANVMIGDFGETVILDWGLAKRLDKADIAHTVRPSAAEPGAPDSPDPALWTEMGSAMGTPCYMSPEQALGKTDVIAECSDIYSLGAVLYEILTGRPPVEGRDVADTLRRVARGQIAHPRSVDHAIDDSLAAIAMRALEREPSRRFESARDLANAVREWRPDAKRQEHLGETVLIVDDTELNVDILVEALGDDYDVVVALDGESALKSIASQAPDLILLDIMMPGMNGYEVCERLKASEETRYIPVIFLTALADAEDEVKGLQLGAADYLTKPFNPDLVKARVFNHLELKRHREELIEGSREKTRELSVTQDVAIECLATLAEYRDPETRGHILRTQKYVGLLLDTLASTPRYAASLDDEAQSLIRKSAPLHDIGKMGVLESLLSKKDGITEEEILEIRKHTLYGCDAIRTAEKRLGSNSFLRYAKEIAESHHERWDGSGYPRGLEGDAIPLSARIMALADAYDALMSDRTYSPPMPHVEAVKILARERGHHFDPGIVDAFLNHEERFRRVAYELADSEHEREMASLEAEEQI
jgi:putative two-component system response regulator